MNLPAICNKCGTIFPSIISATNILNLTIKNCEGGICPKCNSIGRIPDGKFNIIGDVIEILEAPNYSLNDLKKLSKILNRAKAEEEVATDLLCEEIIEEIPIFEKIAELLPQNREEKREDIKWLLVFLGGIISMFLNYYSITKSEPMGVNYENVINYINEENTIINIINTNKIGRNDPCPCGSGVKFKKCHGDWRRKIYETDNYSSEYE